MTVSESVIRWLKGFDASRMKNIDTDMLAADVKSYALIKEPVQNVQSFLSGRKVITDHFTLMARLSGKTNSTRIDNSGFGESLEDWISEQNSVGNYPVVEDAKVQKVSVTTPFILGKSEENDILYQLTIAIQYVKEK